MKYISLFSGIGGFELAIHNLFPEAECIGFSEVDNFALQVYQHHFPSHQNLGDVTQITEETIRKLVEDKGGCDLLVGGFPCQNLSMFSRFGSHGNTDGLQGPKSGLFWNMINILGWIVKYNHNKTPFIVIENNASMKKSDKEVITTTLSQIMGQTIHVTMLNGNEFGVQTRKRLYWTTFAVDTAESKCSQKWDDVLLPINQCSDFVGRHCIENACNKIISTSSNTHVQQFRSTSIPNVVKRVTLPTKGKSRLQQTCSSIEHEKSRTITTSRSNHTMLLDNRGLSKDHFYVRYFEPYELEALFFIPKGWVSEHCSKTRCYNLIGNTVIVRVIEYILKQTP